MSTYVESEEIQATRSEKLLAVILAAFLLVAGVWAYQRIDDWSRAVVVPSVSAAGAVARLAFADQAAFTAKENEQRALDELTLAREAYRTALDADQPAGGLELAYEARQETYTGAQSATREAEAGAAALRPAAALAQRRIDNEERRALERETRLSVALRFVFVVASLSLAYLLLARLRRRESRYLPLGLAAVASAAILALVMASDYVTDYVDPLALGPLVLALVGIVLTLAAFRTLQVYLVRRMPSRRVRKGECPFCGFPVRGNEHCEGCGREVVSACGRCASPRRVGSLHCGTCGEA